MLVTLDSVTRVVRPNSPVGGADLAMRSYGQVACEVITKMEFTVSKVNEKYPMRS